MSVQIYNSLRDQKEAVVPLAGQRLNFYTCGVTVYDLCHIGHGRSLYIFDVMRRYLLYRGFDVFFIRNITDIDDKIIQRAHDLGQDWQTVVHDNIQAYRKDLKDLGILEANAEPRATENIQEMIIHIQGLIDKGFAYVQGGSVYFHVRKFQSYGKLSRQSIENMQEAVRIDKNEMKKEALDFALWKESKQGEPSWESPWGRGRPGWHIECSAMSMKYAQAKTLDIHAGGRDLIFPHHENELAQSEALTGQPFANYWLHHGLLTINHQKMSKSLKNFITIQEALERFGAPALKFFFLSSHYASPLDFNEEKMSEMRKNVERFSIFLAERQDVDAQSDRTLPTSLARYRDEWIVAMDDDFNTPKAMAVFFETISEAYRLRSKQGQASWWGQVASEIASIFQNVFGIVFSLDSTVLTSQEEALLNARAIARTQKDFHRADELRAELGLHGIIVEDSREGQKWRRK